MSDKLNKDEKIEMLKYNISRFDHYYASVNFKSSFLVIGNITITGFWMTNRTQINDYVFYAHLLLITFSLVFVLMAIKPYVKSYEGSESLVFFNDIANTIDSVNKLKTNQLSKDDYITDLREQSFILAKGLKDKFAYLNASTIIFIINICLFFVNMAFIVDSTSGVTK